MSFREIRGQESAVAFLQASIARGKVGHAYLFCGIEGVGKKETALALAKALNCLSPEGTDSCGQCRSCKKIDAGTHADIVEIKAPGAFIRIDQIRALQRTSAHRPLEGRYRVAIIHDIRLLTRESANCLLKLLEEPPEASILVLTAADLEETLPTIVSRCQVVPFRPLPRDVISDYLSAGGHVGSAEELSIAASLAEGSLSRAMRLANASDFRMRREVCRELGSLSRENVNLALALAERLSARKEKLPELLTLLKTYLRDVLAVKRGLGESYLMNQDFKDDLAQCARRWTDEDIIGSWNLLNRAEDAASRNFNRQLILENAFLRLTRESGQQV